MPEELFFPSSAEHRHGNRRHHEDSALGIRDRDVVGRSMDDRSIQILTSTQRLPDELVLCNLPSKFYICLFQIVVDGRELVCPLIDQSLQGLIALSQLLQREDFTRAHQVVGNRNTAMADLPTCSFLAEDEHQTARLVLIFRKEAAGWKICHSSISIPYNLVSTGEIFPLKQLTERNESLERLVDERTNQLSSVNDNLEKANVELGRQIAQHKLVGEALSRSEDLYRSIIHASPDDVTITDSEGRILMVSPVAMSMFGAAGEEEFLGHSVFDFIAPEDRARALSKMALRREGAAAGLSENRGRRIDGRTFDIEVDVRRCWGRRVPRAFSFRFHRPRGSGESIVQNGPEARRRKLN